MKIIKTNIRKITTRLGQAISLAGFSTIVFTSSVFAASDAATKIKEGAGQTGSGGLTLQQGVGIVTNVLLFLIGLIAVIAIIIGGIRYTTSNGDAGQIKSAKDTIMYAVIGLVVALLAYAIVRWVLSTFTAR